MRRRPKRRIRRGRQLAGEPVSRHQADARPRLGDCDSRQARIGPIHADDRAAERPVAPMRGDARPGSLRPGLRSQLHRRTHPEDQGLPVLAEGCSTSQRPFRRPATARVGPQPNATPDAIGQDEDCGADVPEPLPKVVADGPAGSVGATDTALVAEGAMVLSGVPTPDAQPVAATDRQNATGDSCRLRLASRRSNRGHQPPIMGSPLKRPAAAQPDGREPLNGGAAATGRPHGFTPRNLRR